MVLRIEHRAFHAHLLQFAGNVLRFRHVLGTHQLRLAGLLDLHNVLHHCFIAILDAGKYRVLLVKALHGHIRLNHRDIEVVELPQLIPRRHRRAGHATDLGVHPDQRLDGQLIQNATTIGHLQTFLGLHCGLQSIRPALQVRYAPAGTVDEQHFPIAHDVMHIALQQMLSVQRHVDLHQKIAAGGLVVFRFGIFFFRRHLRLPSTPLIL